MTTGLLRPWPANAVNRFGTKASITQDFGGTSLAHEPKGWTVEVRGGDQYRAAATSFKAGSGGYTNTPTYCHPGIDVGLAEGTALYAPEDAVVFRNALIDIADERYRDEKRLTLDIRPGVRLLLTHLRDWRVDEGQKVKRGQVVALSGSSGIVTGPHLHFEVQRKEGERWFRYNSERLFEGGDLAGVDWITPPAAPIVEDDMPPLVTYIPGHTATVAKGYRVRDEPSTATGTPLRTTTAPETWTVIGYAKGEAVDGVSDWLMRWNGHYEYVHRSGVSQVAPPSGDCTAAVAAATKPLDDKLLLVARELNEARARISAGVAALTQ